MHRRTAPRVEAGRRPDRREFLEKHAHLGPALAECLEALESLRVAGPRLSQGGTPSPAAPETDTPREPGDFRIVREVGRGGRGLVYEAVQLSLKRKVALKVLPFAATLDPRRLQRFQNEAQAAAGLHHTNIVPVYGVSCERGVHYYAMQFIEGQTLASAITSLRRQRGLDPADADADAPAADPAQPTTAYPPPVSPSAPPAPSTQAAAALSMERPAAGSAYYRRVAELGVQVAEAPEHAHGLGVVHRDIKPANLMLDGRGNLWVTDFGLAQVQSGDNLTLTGDLVGTLPYMSPEQALAKRVVIDHRTDVYSLGATLYELLTLRPAFAGADRQELLRQIAFEEPTSPRKLDRRIPAELETILLKALEKNPAERYASGRDLADDLRQFLDNKRSGPADQR